MLRNGSAAVTRLGFLDIGGAGAGRRLQQFLQEGGLAAARWCGAALEGNEMAIFQPVMTHARHLVLLVEIDRQNLALENGGIEEGDLLLGGRDVIPAVIV